MDKRHFPFWKKLSIYCAAWLALILIVCASLWGLVSQFEKSRPETAVKNFINLPIHDMFYQTMMQSYPNVDNPYESQYNITTTIAKQFAGPFSYYKSVREYTYETPVYIIKSGDTDIIKLTLLKNDSQEALSFGSYSVKHVEFTKESGVVPQDYTLIFPNKSAVTVNNNKLNTELVQYAFGNENFAITSLNGFFENPNVEATHSRAELEKITFGNCIFFNAAPIALDIVKINSPKNASVFLNGVKLDGRFITNQYTNEADSFGSAAEWVEYSVPALAEDANVSATLDNEALNVVYGSGVYTASLPTRGYTVKVPDGAVLYANGEKVSEEFISNENGMMTDYFAGVNAYPSATEYYFEDLHANPIFEAELDGEKLIMISEKSSASFAKKTPEELCDEYSHYAKELINRYLNYTTQGKENTKSNLIFLLEKVAKNSLLESYLNASYKGYTYIDTQKLEVVSIDVSNLIFLNDDAFICDVTYKIMLENFVGKTEEENSFRLAFIRENEEFLAVSISAID